MRELLSNASDALHRLRFEMVTNQNVLDPQAELKIRVKADKGARTLTLQEPGSELQALIIEQIYDSALLVEGLHPDPSSIAPRVQQIIEAALTRNL
ncbi:MAG: hypothetical protein AB1750_17875 [Chloroflexota bacterium]